MARYDQRRVPRGTSRRWEVVLADDGTKERPEAPRLSARDVRAQHRVLQDFSEAELAQIPLLAEGDRLVRFKEYLDLHNPARANFRAEGTEAVRPGQRIVARSDIAPAIWERLIASAADIVGWRKRRTA